MIFRVIWIILFLGTSSPMPICVAETLGHLVFVSKQEQCGLSKAQVNTDSMFGNSPRCVSMAYIAVEMLD